MKRGSGSRRFRPQVAMIFALFSLTQILCAQAPTRLNDKDIENLINNLKNDTKLFRSRFDSAIKKSTIRKTSQEKDAKNLAAQFANQIAAMQRNFKQNRKAENLPSVMSTSDQIDKLVSDLKLDSATTASWQKVRQELSQVASSFGVTGQQ
jgi:methionyl-tRNA synthetase